MAAYLGSVMRAVVARGVLLVFSPALVAVAAPAAPSTRTALDRLVERVDPGRDGWPTEVLSGAASSQLKTLAKFMSETQGPVEPALLSVLVAPSFTCAPLRPRARMTVPGDDVQVVLRMAPASSQSPGSEARVHQGARGLATALDDLLGALSLKGPGRVAFKLFDIARHQDHFKTRSLLEASKVDGEQATQLSATWLCTWAYPSEEGVPPRLLDVSVEGYEELRRPAGALFGDVTQSAMESNTSYAAQVLPGLDHWLPRLDRLVGLSMFGYHGLAVGDVNGDGLEDLVVADTGGLPNRLYLQLADGTVRDASAESGLDWLDYSAAPLLVDLDGDGDLDLAMSMSSGLALAENDGAGHFRRRGLFGGDADPTSVSAADYDLDGDLDLYLCRYGEATNARGRTSPPEPIPYHDANNGGSNILLRNDGGFVFTDVTEAVGLDVRNSRFSFAASWEDYDDDGDVDLYVANDFGRNNLYCNEGGRFVEVAGESGVEDTASGMSVSWGDYDRDGLSDLYVSNMFSAAGSRIAYQAEFLEKESEDKTVKLQRMARGNSLFANQGDGGFRDVSVDAGVTMGRWAWASQFADVNNDGWLDLVVANGYLTGERPDDL